MIPLFLNSLVAISVKLLVSCTGPWIADVDVDLDISGIAPTGKATLAIGTNVLLGTIDPLHSGKYGPHARIRVVGGGNGWDTKVSPLPFHNDAQVLSTMVIEATAAEVGEVAIVAVPVPLGVDYVRMSGSASKVFAGAPWYVDFQGITQVSPRIPFPQNPLIHEVLEWNPTTKAATIATDDVLKPGMILLDPRFTTATVIDVEQTFSADGGASSTCWCGDLPTSLTGQTRLVNAIASIVRDAADVQKLRRYQCRILAQTPDGRMTLQPVSPKSGMPVEVNAFPPWYGVPGVSAMIVPGTLCDVQFDDQGQPHVVNFQGGAVTQLSFGGGVDFVALSTKVDLALAAMVSAFNSHTHVYSPGPSSPVPTAPPLPQASAPAPTAAAIVKAT